MPNRNSSDRPRGRKNSSDGSRSKGNSFDKKSNEGRGDSRGSGPSKRSASKRPSRGSDDSPRSGRTGFSSRPGTGKPFKKGPRKFDQPRDDSAGSRRGAPRSFGPPRERRGPAGGDREQRSFGKPDYKKRGPRTEGGDDKPRARKAFGDRDDSAGSRQSGPRSFGPPRERRGGAGDRDQRPSGRPDFKKRGPRTEGGENKSGFRKSFGDRDEKPARSRPRTEGSRVEKTPFERRDDKKFERTGVRKEGKNLHEDKTGAVAPVANAPIRLNKYIANSGVCSRREADDLISMGLISVNGKVITTLGYKVNPGDEVRHESKILKAEKPVYILLNKPKGFLTTTTDPQERNTVMHLVGNIVKERIYPVGRLDRNTTGLLLLTNDGDLADKLMHPSYNVKKIYRVDLDRPLTKADVTKIMEGVQLEEGKAVVDDLAIISDDGKTVGLEIHIGWNRVVRRIFESLDYQVVKLDRSFYAGLTKKDLGRGEWRFLTKEELVLLKHYK